MSISHNGWRLAQGGLDRAGDLGEDHFQQRVLAVEIRIEPAHADPRRPRQVAQAHGLKPLLIRQIQRRVQDQRKLTHRKLGLLDRDAVAVVLKHRPAEIFGRGQMGPGGCHADMSPAEGERNRVQTAMKLLPAPEEPCNKYIERSFEKGRRS